MNKHLFLGVIISMLMAGSCQGQKPYERAAFKKYWYAGKAEINSYILDQSRYGQQRSGKAVLIFVTENFSRSKQVKIENPDAAINDKVSVLKLNFTKNFVTGIYPYTMMLSTFTPVDRNVYPNTLKATASSQEWCGQVFAQLNLTGDQFNVKSYSYFEEEGDKQFSLEKKLLEDEVWNIIRLDYTTLPVGNIRIIPGLFFTRLNHVDLQSIDGRASLSEEKETMYYIIELPSLKRKLSIQFQKDFPHKILGWQEEFEERGIHQSTKASLDKTLFTDYWTKNKNEFQYLRDSLNLSND